MRLSLIPASEAEPAPELDVAQWFGDPTPLSSVLGKVVVVHAFQMLCPGCVLHGTPQASRIQQVFPADQVAVIGLHAVFEHHDAMTPVSLGAFLHEFRVTFPVAVDAPGERLPRTMATYALRGTPSLLLIDRKGRLRANHFGQAEDLEIGAAIATLMHATGS